MQHVNLSPLAKLVNGELLADSQINLTIDYKIDFNQQLNKQCHTVYSYSILLKSIKSYNCFYTYKTTEKFCTGPETSRSM